MRNLMMLFVSIFSVLLMGSDAAAQKYPQRPIELVVPYPPGGVADLLARLVSPGLSERLGQPVVVVNKGGAGGNIAAALVKNAPSDGYTLLFGNVAVLAINPTLYKAVPFDPLKDFAPISLVASSAQMLVVHPALPVNSVAELIAYAKERPGKLNYSSGSIGSATHLAMEQLKTMAGFEAVHLPFKGSGPGLAALAAGQTQLMIENIPTALPFVRDGRFRALAVTSVKRSPLVPHLPTIAESGFPGYEITAWFGVQAPAKTLSAIVSQLSRAIATTVQSSEMRERMASMGAEPVTSTPEEFASFIKAEYDKWAKIVRISGATVD
jgi:tripartite-type tricarboxylate transporter receptor subunit TctC